MTLWSSFEARRAFGRYNLDILLAAVTSPSLLIPAALRIYSQPFLLLVSSLRRVVHRQKHTGLAYAGQVAKSCSPNTRLNMLQGFD